MKREIYFSVLALTLFAFTACTNNEQRTNEQYKNEFKIRSEITQIDSLNVKAVNDTAFYKSSEYATQMERSNIQIAKEMAGLTENEKLLLLYEFAINEHKSYSQQSKKKPSLLKEKSFYDAFKQKSDKVRKLYMQLNEVSLSIDEKKKFDELSLQ